MLALNVVTGHMLGDLVFQNDYLAAHKHKDSKVCALHCLIYTILVAFFVGGAWPWWTWPLVFASHFAVDRWTLARKWMTYAKQENFATGRLSPWSIVAVDQTAHLASLCFIHALATLPLSESLGAMSFFVILASVLKDVLRRLPTVPPVPDETALVVEACESVNKLMGSLAEAVNTEVKVLKDNNAEGPIVVDPSISFADGEPVKAVRVMCDLGILLDVVPSAKGSRVFMPVLPSDTLDDWRDRFGVVLETFYEGEVPAGLAASPALDERYSQWVADDHSCASLDHMLKPATLLVSPQKHQRMLDVADVFHRVDKKLTDAIKPSTLAVLVAVGPDADDTSLLHGRDKASRGVVVSVGDGVALQAGDTVLFNSFSAVEADKGLVLLLGDEILATVE